MNRIIVTIAIINLVLCGFIFAQEFPYKITDGCCQFTKKIIVNHAHNWEMGDIIHNLVETDDELIFTDRNNFSETSLVNDITAFKEWKWPTPAFSKIVISDNSEYILGLSDLKYNNPYQIVIFKQNGDIVYRKHISTLEAKLTEKDYIGFQKEYPLQDKFLNEKYRITHVFDYVYIDYKGTNIYCYLGKPCLDYLDTFSSNSHFSPYFSESYLNWINWYFQPDPQVKFIFNGEQLEKVSLLDPHGDTFEIIVSTPQDGWVQKILQFKPPVDLTGELNLQCVNCKKEFNIDDKIVFNLRNDEDNPIYIGFGIKVKKEGKWEILTTYGSESYFKKPYYFKKNETRIVEWDKNVMITKEWYDSGEVDSRTLSRYGYYDITQGGEFMIYAHRGDPFKKELFKYEFRIFPAKK